MALGDKLLWPFVSRLCDASHLGIGFKKQPCEQRRTTAAIPCQSNWGVSVRLARQLRPTRPGTASHYFFSNGAGVDAGRSEFQISIPHFHFPLARFSQTSTYLPRSLTGLPLASFMLSS